MTKDEFKASIKDKGLVLVDFYADWCGPCKMMNPILEEIDQHYDDLTIMKIDADKEKRLAMGYGVMSIPDLILFNNGEALYQFIGFTSKEDLCTKIDEYRSKL